jgi:hypothetical protein
MNSTCRLDHYTLDSDSGWVAYLGLEYENSVEGAEPDTSSDAALGRAYSASSHAGDDTGSSSSSDLDSFR